MVWNRNILVRMCWKYIMFVYEFGVVFCVSVSIIIIIPTNINTCQCFDTNQTYIPRNDDGESPSFLEWILTEIQRAGLQFKLSESFSITHYHWLALGNREKKKFGLLTAKNDNNYCHLNINIFHINSIKYSIKYCILWFFDISIAYWLIFKF